MLLCKHVRQKMSDRIDGGASNHVRQGERGPPTVNMFKAVNINTSLYNLALIKAILFFQHLLPGSAPAG